IAFTLFDPNNQILKKVTFQKSKEELLQQAEKAPFMIDRWQAIFQLREVPLAEKRDVYLRLLQQEQFHAIHGEILAQTIRQDEEIALIGFRSPSNDVRKAAVNNINRITEEQKEIIIQYFNDENSSYELLSRSLELLIKNEPTQIKKYLEMSSHLIGVGRSFR